MTGFHWLSLLVGQVAKQDQMCSQSYRILLVSNIIVFMYVCKLIQSE